jgi:hypothetical protein
LDGWPESLTRGSLTYTTTKKGQGWGVIAKSLGIKPGSPEFHALKRGDFVFNGKPREVPGKGKGKGKGKTK